MKIVKLKSIKKISYEKTRCITVANPNGLYVTDGGIVTHNSLLTVLVNLYIAVHFALMWHPYKFFGQSQPLTSKVMLPDGSYKLMGDVKVGDVIKSPTSGTTSIKEVKDWDDDEVYEFELENGKKVKSGENHLWKVSYRKNENGKKLYDIVTTKFIIKNIDKYNFDIPSL